MKGSGSLETESRPEFRHIGSEVATVAAPTATLRAANPVRSANLLRTASFAILAVSFLAVGFGVYKWSAGRGSPLHLQNMRITRLTENGKAKDVAISPDGSYVVYVLREGEKQSLWVRQVAAHWF
jgi:hypothetical protein